VALRPLAVIPLQPQESGHIFDVNIEGVAPGFYLLGGGSQENTVMMALGEEPQVQVLGACPSLSRAQVISPGNQVWLQVQKRNEQLTARTSQLLNQYRATRQGNSDASAILSGLAQVDQERLAMIDSLAARFPLLAKAQALYAYLSYPNYGSAYPSEAAYFAETYLARANLSDPAYDRIPMLHEQARTYGQTLTQLGLTYEQMQTYGQTLLKRLPAPGRAHKSVLLGLVSGFRGKEDDAFAFFANEYVKAYGSENPFVTQQLQGELKGLAGKLIGSVAPEIALPTPEGDTLRLSSLRGKVVLIDFWASWCGPCRRENPNVLRVYNQYKDKGFEILGVSLDSRKENWVQAIAADKLAWRHVSDLKQWNSAAGRLYGVHSIPYTVLLDAEGRIIAKNLRGAALEQKLAEVLAQ
jgi:thiol-disulfide isomerase/thioredoxin